MGEKEIIKKAFACIEEQAEKRTLPRFDHYMPEEHQLYSFCYVPFEREAIFDDDPKLSYERILQNGLIDLLLEISIKRGHTTKSQKRKISIPVPSEEEWSRDTIVFKELNRITCPFIYSLFEKDIVFFFEPAEQIYSFAESLDPYGDECDIIDFSTLFNVFLKDKSDKDMLFVCLQRNPYKTLQLGHYDMFKKTNEDLAEVGASYLYLEDYLNLLFSNETKEAFKNGIKNYNECIKEFETSDGLCRLIKKYYLSDASNKQLLNFYLDYVADSYGSNPSKVARQINNHKYLSSEALRHYVDYHLRTTENKRDLEWFVTLITSESLFNEIGFLKGCDNTSIAAGYLKSIEQLLTNLVLDDIKNGKAENKVDYPRIKRRDKITHKPIYQTDQNGNIKYHEGRFLEISESNRDSKITLEKLLCYLENSKKFLGKQERRDLVARYVDEWFVNDRNGFLHKHVIYSYKKLSEIRQNTLSITLMILNAYYFEDFYGDSGEEPLVKEKYFDLVCPEKQLESFFNSFPDNYLLFEYIKRKRDGDVLYYAFDIFGYNREHHFSLYSKEDAEYLGLKNTTTVSTYADVKKMVVDDRTDREKRMLEDGSLLPELDQIFDDDFPDLE